MLHIGAAPERGWLHGHMHNNMEDKKKESLSYGVFINKSLMGFLLFVKCKFPLCQMVYFCWEHLPKLQDSVMVFVICGHLVLSGGRGPKTLVSTFAS